jgi:micrococcal nuclease
VYEYTATIIKVVDGDTVHLDVDLGFDIKRKDSFRLMGINAPEMKTPEGIVSRNHLCELLNWPANSAVVVTTHKDQREKYGRYLATLFIDGKNINDAMVEAGEAVPYSGGKR